MTVPEQEDEPSRRPALAERPGIVERAAARIVAAVEPVVGRALGVPRIAMAHAVVRRFSAASGPVLARGLAFVALFALVPAVLVVLSIVGIFVADPAVRSEIAAILATQVPPLAPVLDEALASFSGLAPATGIVGVLLLVWTASSLVRALDGAFRVVFEDDGAGRTPIRDVVAVAAVAGGIVAAAVVLVLVTLPGPVGEAFGLPGPLGRAAGSLAGVTGVVALAFRFVPRPRPTWRGLWAPALVTSLAIFGLTALFGILGPLLFGSAQLYGAFGALFLGLIWLGNVTQVLLLGAAWVAERDRRARRRGRERSMATTSS
ncbi:MAG: YihY/virulence factor BrkB family protein [Chloroflexota bacterium]